MPAIESIQGAILTLRGQRVMLGADLARLYDVETERLNQQVKRNLARLPPDFMFQISADEWQGTFLQIAGTLQRSRRRDRLPLAFTEHG